MEVATSKYSTQEEIKATTMGATKTDRAAPLTIEAVMKRPIEAEIGS